MARTRRALAAPSSRGWRLCTASRTFRVLHRLTVILSLRRIRDPSVRRDEVRILRLRSQARFAQDDTALRERADQVQHSRVSRSGRIATAGKAVRRRGPGRVVLGSKPQLATAKELVRWALRATGQKNS